MTTRLEALARLEAELARLDPLVDQDIKDITAMLVDRYWDALVRLARA